MHASLKNLTNSSQFVANFHFKTRLIIQIWCFFAFLCPQKNSILVYSCQVHSLLDKFSCREFLFMFVVFYGSCRINFERKQKCNVGGWKNVNDDEFDGVNLKLIFLCELRGLNFDGQSHKNWRIYDDYEWDCFGGNWWRFFMQNCVSYRQI